MVHLRAQSWRFVDQIAQVGAERRQLSHHRDTAA